MKYLKCITAAVFFTAFSLKSQTDSAKVETVNLEKVQPFQFTFVTPVGTNGIESFKTTNHVSLNLLVGVSKGLDGFEAGGIANIILKDVKGAQFAGFTNIVLGKVNGGQFASYFNYCGKDLKGVQVAGLGNVSLGAMKGAQVASVFNFNRKGGTGVQVAAYTNVVLGNIKGVQVASMANIAIGDVQGAQISAGVNIAKKVKGIQLGFVNIADSVDGASIGFVNIIKKGKNQFEFSGDELFYTNIAYRSGTSSFYNIYTAGYRPGTKENLWHIGYGAGTAFKLKNKLTSDINVTMHHVSDGGFYWGTSELVRLYWGVEYKVAKKIAIAAGPTCNFYVSDVLLSDYKSSKQNILPYHNFDQTTNNDFNVKGWLGARIAIRFL
jgi:hypothetical protein